MIQHSAFCLSVTLMLLGQSVLAQQASPAPDPDVGSGWEGWYIVAMVEPWSGERVSGERGRDIDAEHEGVAYGLSIGRRRDMGQAVFGAAFDIASGGGDYSEGNKTADISRLWFARFAMDLGYPVDQFLFYGTTGLSAFRANAEGGIDGSLRGVGGFYGAGVDMMVTDTVLIGAQVRREAFANTDFDLTTVDDYTTKTSAILRLGYRW